jgi:Transposase, Mutator family
MLGMNVGPSEAETFWTEFLHQLRRRGLRGVKLVVVDAQEGVKAAVSKVLIRRLAPRPLHAQCARPCGQARTQAISEAGHVEPVPPPAHVDLLSPVKKVNMQSRLMMARKIESIIHFTCHVVPSGMWLKFGVARSPVT